MGVEGDWSSSQVKGSALAGSGGSATARQAAEPAGQDAPRQRKSPGEYRRANAFLIIDRVIV